MAPEEKTSGRALEWGRHLFDFKEKLQTYRKLITETGLAETDFTRSTAFTRSLQMVLEAKWVREEVIGLAQTIPIFTYKLWVF